LNDDNNNNNNDNNNGNNGDDRNSSNDGSVCFARYFLKVFFCVTPETEIRMASKLRRTPLFGYDGNLGIPILPAPSAAKGNDAGSADYGFKVSILSGLNGVWIAATKTAPRQSV
jgi:hypothetical protein